MERKEVHQNPEDLFEGVSESHSQGEKLMMKREIDSIDDFEHLGHDTSPISDIAKNLHETNIKKHTESPTRENLGVVIDKGVENTTNTATKLADDLASFDPIRKIDSLLDQPLQSKDIKMDSNLLEMGDNFQTNVPEEKMDKYIDELSLFTTSPKLADLTPEKEQHKKDDYKSALQNFMDSERQGMMTQPQTKSISKEVVDLLDRYSDSEDDFKPSTDEDFLRKSHTSSPFDITSSKVKTEAFQDVEEHDDDEQEDDDEEPFRQHVFEPKPFKVPEPFKAPEIVKVSEPLTPETLEPYKPFEVTEPVKEPEVATKPPPKSIDEIQVIEPEKEQIQKTETKTSKQVMEAEAIFCRMGLGMSFF